MQLSKHFTLNEMTKSMTETGSLPAGNAPESSAGKDENSEEIRQLKEQLASEQKAHADSRLQVSLRWHVCPVHSAQLQSMHVQMTEVEN